MRIFNRPFPSSAIWKGDILCSFALKTSGPDFNNDVVTKIAFLPMTCEFEHWKDVAPLTLTMKPKINGSLKDMKLGTRMELLKEMNAAYTQEAGVKFLFGWLEKFIDLDQNKIILLTSNFHLKYPFLVNWLGIETYNHIFAKQHRDLFSSAFVLDDKCEFNLKGTPFWNSEAAVFSTLQVPSPKHKNVLQEAILIAKAYKMLITFAI